MHSHGGAREGSGGPKKYGEKQRLATRPINVPGEIPKSVVEKLIFLYYEQGPEALETLLNNALNRAQQS